MERKNKSVNRRLRAHYRGMIAEYFCMIRLWCAGYGIRARRWKAAGGEIDLIAVRGRTVAFIEVKARATKEAALFAVTPAKRRHITMAAQAWLAHTPAYANHGLRFDAMVVTSSFRIHHLKGAWTA
jgi:putative endonuclease